MPRMALARHSARVGARQPASGDGGAATGISSRAGDELVGQQVAAVGEHLTELDEGDAASFDCQPNGVGQAARPSEVRNSSRRPPRR